MNILQLSEDFYPKTSGGAFEDWEVVTSLAEAGHEVIVVTPRSQETPRREQQDGVDIHRPYTVSAKHPNSLIGQLTRIKFALLVVVYLLRLSLTEPFDVVYATNHLFHPVAKLVGFIRGYPVVNYVAYSPSLNEQARSWSNPLYLLEQVNFRLFMGSLVLCRTPSIRDIIAEHSAADVRLVDGMLKADTVRRVTETSDTPPAMESYADGTNHTLLYVGRFVAIKNPVGAIEVLAALPSTYQLVMIGDGPQRDEVERAIERYDVTERVTLLGHCPHETTLQYIQAADVLVLTSDTEAYPTVVFEALTLETPVVVSPVGVLPEISHPRLHLCSVADMPEVIMGREFTSGQGLDSDTLARFSTDRYTREVSTTLNKAVNQDTGDG